LIKPEWIVRPERIQKYLAAAEHIDHRVWTTVCNPGSVAVELDAMGPKYTYLTNPVSTPVMLVHDLGLYKTTWGTLMFGKLSAYNEYKPFKRYSTFALGAGLNLTYPEVFMKQFVMPSYVGRYHDIGQSFKGLI